MTAVVFCIWLVALEAGQTTVRMVAHPKGLYKSKQCVPGPGWPEMDRGGSADVNVRLHSQRAASSGEQMESAVA